MLNALASIPRHFLARYASRDRQCKLGYDSSGACDAFQLGQLVRFLCAKNLAFVVDFGPDSLDALPDTSGLDVETVVAALRTCPAYQVDKHHSNCGPRLRIDPVLDYLGAALSGGALAIPLADWRRRRADVSWAAAAEAEEGGTFAFTRALANDQRLRYDGAMYADAMARRLFTARAWDWTPEV